MGMIWGIWKMLGLHAKSVAPVISLTTFADNAAVQKISRVKLHSRFGSEDFHAASACFVPNTSDGSELPGRFIEDPVMIKTFGVLNLLVATFYVCSDGRGLSKIKWSACNWAQFAGGNHRRVNRGKFICINLDQVIEHIASSMEIEIGVMS